MVMKGRINFVLPTLGALFTLALTACGDSSTDSNGTDLAAVAAKSASITSLPLEPINLANAQAPLTAAAQPLPVCPWLSDASANAAVDNVFSSEPMMRRAVSSNECKWNLNAGFALKIRAVPLAEAVSPSSVTYNMDNPPVLAAQEGPGSDAVALLDPTWDADKPRPFAFVFNADNRQFKITTTGVKTSVDRLRAVADEIVGALSSTAPVVEVKDVEPTLDPCVYDGATVAALFGGTAGEALTQKPYVPGSSCKYSGFAGNTALELTIRFGGDPLVPPSNLDPEFVLTDEFGPNVYVKDMAARAGYGSTARAYEIERPGGQIRVDLLVGAETFPDVVAEQLLENLIVRTN